jgi:predicted aconitase
MAFQGQAPQQCIELGIDDLQRSRRELGQNSEQPLAGIALGTPHFSYTEFEQLVGLLGGREVSPGLVFT